MGFSPVFRWNLKLCIVTGSQKDPKTARNSEYFIRGTIKPLIL
jgi:hypothetical protein